MTQIEFANDLIQLDAGVLAKAFRISEEALKQGMREGTITSRFERGEEEDAGKIRLTFFSAERRVRLTADDSGQILSCSAVEFKRPKMAAQAGPDPSGQRPLDALLDTALMGTFPASDPIAVSFDAPRSGTSEDG